MSVADALCYEELSQVRFTEWPKLLTGNQNSPAQAIEERSFFFLF